MRKRVKRYLRLKSLRREKENLKLKREGNRDTRNKSNAPIKPVLEPVIKELKETRKKTRDLPRNLPSIERYKPNKIKEKDPKKEGSSVSAVGCDSVQYLKYGVRKLKEGL